MTPGDRNKAIRQLVLPRNARLILYDLAARCNAQDQCWPARKTLARANDMSVPSVERALRQLRKAGLLSIRHGKGNRSVYQLRLNETRSITSDATVASPVMQPIEVVQGRGDALSYNAQYHPIGQRCTSCSRTVPALMQGDVCPVCYGQAQTEPHPQRVN